MDPAAKHLMTKIIAHQWNATPPPSIYYRIAKQGNTTNSVILNIIEKNPIATKETPRKYDEATLQIDIYTNTDQESHDITFELREILDGYSYLKLLDCIYVSEQETFSEISEKIRTTQTYNITIKNTYG